MALLAAAMGYGGVLRLAATSLALSAGTASAVSRLRIVNGCPLETIWIAHEAANEIGPDAQNVEIKAGESHDFETPDNLLATRYWPKMGCDKRGGSCGLGGSGGPGESCVKTSESGAVDYSRCAPPVDTKFEASFGTNGEPCNPAAPGGTEMAGCDYVDVSLVDGWTLPFKLEIDGGQCKATMDGVDQIVKSVDCSTLHFKDCPRTEDLSAAGFVADLRAMNPRTGEQAGCYSPCMLLQDEKWNNSRPKDFESTDDHVAPYCCPTPPETPEACRAGPITTTQFLKTVHTKCPGVYGYAYDDGMGLMRCESSSKYTVTFYCPDELPPDVQKMEEEKERKRKEEEERKRREAEEAEKKRKEEEEAEKQREEQEEAEKEKQLEEERAEKEKLRKEEEAQEHLDAAGEQEPDGFCCFHAKNPTDACGTCHPLGRAEPSSFCARSHASCQACGGAGRWCDLGGGSAATEGLVGRFEAPPQGLPAQGRGGGLLTAAAELVAACALALAAAAARAALLARRAGGEGGAYRRAPRAETAGAVPAAWRPCEATGASA